MYSRALSKELIEAAREFPVVTVLGPRQSGKTTLVRQLFANKPYVSIEDPDQRTLVETDPRSFLANHPDGAILDEVQRVPELLSYLQGDVDNKQQMGRWILTGSHQTSLHQGISQSLAGRTAIAQLLPMTLAEMDSAELQSEIPEVIINGFYPGRYQRGIAPGRFYRAYFKTYLERDVRQLIQLRDLVAFDNFMRLLAGHVGQLINYSQFATPIGVSHHTIREWMSVLEASFLIYRLPPYFENFNKRVTKSPRLYFTDVGLACYLLGIETTDQLLRDPSYGRLYENLVITECLKQRYNAGAEPEMYFFRDLHGNEVDLILRRGRELIPIEIKASQTPQKAMTAGLDRFRKLAGDRVQQQYVVYNGAEHQLNDSRFVNLRAPESEFMRI